MPLELRIDRAVVKALKKLPSYDMRAIYEVIRLLPSDPFFGDIQKMKGEGDVWRRRIGSYRIFYKINASTKTILVFRIERRTSTTY